MSDSIESWATGTYMSPPWPAPHLRRTDASGPTSQTCLEKVRLTSHPTSGLPMRERAGGLTEVTEMAGQKACRAHKLQGVYLSSTRSTHFLAGASQRQEFSSPAATQEQAESSASQISLGEGLQPFCIGQNSHATDPPLTHLPLPKDRVQLHVPIAAQTQAFGANLHVPLGDLYAFSASASQSICGIIPPSHCRWGMLGSTGIGMSCGKSTGRTTSRSSQVRLATLTPQSLVSMSAVGLCWASSHSRRTRNAGFGSGSNGGSSRPADISLILSRQGRPPSRAGSRRKSTRKRTILWPSVLMSCVT
mmetsp:Transcript_84360/g.251426  ORF Transcript_84360/g.251426 Transcript_84360/m.251426 type:complete len:305 (-) Transcript_84360:357-1271(-)